MRSGGGSPEPGRRSGGRGEQVSFMGKESLEPSSVLRSAHLERQTLHFLGLKRNEQERVRGSVHV